MAWPALCRGLSGGRLQSTVLLLGNALEHGLPLAAAVVCQVAVPRNHLEYPKLKMQGSAFPPAACKTS